MKAEELRIGNFILDNEAEPTKKIYWRVEQINQYRIGDKRIGVLFRGGSCWTVMDCIEPIPLTEEWLLKFGLIELYWSEDNSNLNKDIQVGYFNNDFINEEITLRYKKKVDFKIRYVHQLQNLYFALTGTELELKK
jgi:hypothetical protein